MKFTKMNGLGNDYVFVYADYGLGIAYDKAAIAISDRHHGIGSDGLVIISKCNNADFAMRIFNADGSEAEICGNALRCVAKYVYEKGLANKRNISVLTKAGVKSITVSLEEEIVTSVTVNMGRIRCNVDSPVAIGPFIGYKVDAGNPHFVVFVETINDEMILDAKNISEDHTQFERGANVEFCTVNSFESASMRVYERGSGETLACGSGAAATFYVANKLKLINDEANINLLGGTLRCRLDKNDNVFVTGPAEYNFEGEIKTGDTLWQRLI